MSSAQFIAIIIGIFGALAGVYFREVLRKANARLKAAVYLESNLTHWFKTCLENEHFKDIMISGYFLSEEKRKAIETGNLEELSKFKEEFKTKLQSLRDDSKGLKEKILEIIQRLKPFKKEELDEIIKELDRIINSLVEGNGLVRDSDLAYLDWFLLPDILEVRSELVSILVSLKLLLTHLSVRNSIDEEFVLNQAFSCVDSSLKVTMHIVPLLKYAQTICRKGIWGNIFV